MTPETAEAVALEALRHVVADERALARFLALCGATPEALRAGAANAAFLAGVLDFVLSDETLLSGFCAAARIAPELPARARAALPGAAPPW
jgi:negative regulator of sigma E activity